MENKKRGRPQKTADVRRDQYLEVRLGQTEKDAFARAAEMAGLPLSSWVRERLRIVAKKELEALGERVRFLR